MAVMEEAELHRMATDISLAEEKAATHGKGLNFFAEQKLHADRRKRNSKRRQIIFPISFTPFRTAEMIQIYNN